MPRVLCAADQVARGRDGRLRAACRGLTPWPADLAAALGVVPHRTSPTASSVAAESRGRILSPTYRPFPAQLPEKGYETRGRVLSPSSCTPARAAPPGPAAPATASSHPAESRGRILSPTYRPFPAQLLEKGYETRGRILSPSSCAPRGPHRPARPRRQHPPRRSPRTVELFPDSPTLPRATSRENAHNPRKEPFPYFPRPRRTPKPPTGRPTPHPIGPRAPAPTLVP